MESQGSKGDLNKLSIAQRIPMSRKGFGTKGKQIQLETNHYKVDFGRTDVFFHHYNDILKYEDGKPVEKKGVGTKVIEKLMETYASELANNNFAYDGDKNLYMIQNVPQKNYEFTVVVENTYSAKTTTSRTTGGNGSPGGSDMKRMRRPLQAKVFKVELSSAGKVPMDAITQVLRGEESESCQDALRVLDIILRQRSAKQGCLLVRQSFFHNSPSNFMDLGGGVMGCRGFHSSFRPTNNGISLNVVTFFSRSLAKRALKNLRIKTTHTNSEFRIIGLSEKTCYEQKFTLKQRNNGNGGSDTEEVTVYDYFEKRWGIELKDSAHFPCLNVEKPDRPTYLPLEVCNLVSLQRYTKALSTLQRSSLVTKSWQNPSERKLALSNALEQSNYNSDNMLKECGISIGQEFIRVDGRILDAPQVKAGCGQDLVARNGRWNFNNRSLFRTKEVKTWGVVNFSTRRDVQNLIRCGKIKGIQMGREDAVIEESPQMKQGSTTKRVDVMFEEIKSVFKKLPPTFLLCVLPEKKSEIYGPWKCKCLSEFGIVTQCLAPNRPKIDDQYLTNVLLKINAKLGGLNSLLEIERINAIPLVSTTPTIIFGMDVSHGSPGRSDVPSVAAVVSSLEWPLISKYKASVCTQSPKHEMIDCLFKPDEKVDHGLIQELLRDFYISSNNRKPGQIIIFRDRVSESQFTQVLNKELAQIIEACKFLDDTWSPKFTVIVAQKNHHTRFFLPNAQKPNDNVQPGTVVDNGICHPRNYDFYMCAHNGTIGTTRPTHYHVLHDDIGFSPDDLQGLVHSLSYVYQRSTTAISVVAPIYYTHLAAAQAGQFIKLDDVSETSSSHGAHTSSTGSIAVPALPPLHKNVASSMFFC